MLQTIISNIEDNAIPLARRFARTSSNALHIERSGFRRPRHKDAGGLRAVSNDSNFPMTPCDERTVTIANTPYLFIVSRLFKSNTRASLIAWIRGEPLSITHCNPPDRIP